MNSEMPSALTHNWFRTRLTQAYIYYSVRHSKHSANSLFFLLFLQVKYWGQFVVDYLENGKSFREIENGLPDHKA